MMKYRPLFAAELASRGAGSVSEEATDCNRAAKVPVSYALSSKMTKTWHERTATVVPLSKGVTTGPGSGAASVRN
jgi:hypothetical protein